MEGLLTLFLFPALAGYLVLTKTKLYSIRIHAYSATRLFAESVLFGIGLLYVSSFLTFIAAWVFEKPYVPFKDVIFAAWGGIVWPLRNEIMHPVKTSDQNQSIQLTTEAILTVLIALLYWGVDYLLASMKPEKRRGNIIKVILMRILDRLSIRHNAVILRERDKLGGTVEKLFALSMNSFMPVMITLKSRKVYIAIIKELPPLSPFNRQQRFVNIYPLYSGYRDSETMSLSKDMTDYQVMTDLMLLSEGLEPANAKYKKRLANILNNVDDVLLDNLDRGIAIDSDEIISVSLWDGDIFKEFNRDKIQ